MAELLKQLKQLSKNLGEIEKEINYTIALTFIGQHDERISNVKLAAIMEAGNPHNGTKPRPAIAIGYEQVKPELKPLLKFYVEQAIKSNIVNRTGINEIADRMLESVKQSYLKLHTPILEETTIERRIRAIKQGMQLRSGLHKPLIFTGKLLDSMTVRVYKNGEIVYQKSVGV